MQMDFRDSYNNELKNLEEEEAYLEQYLRDNIALNDDEVTKIRNRISGIKSTKEEINQIITGAFY